MPLSEHEQKLLEQLEKQLHEDDPKFASSMGSDAGRSWSTRHLVIGVLAALAGSVRVRCGVSWPCGAGRGGLLRHHAWRGRRQGQSRRCGPEVRQAQEFVHEQS